MAARKKKSEMTRPEVASDAPTSIIEEIQRNYARGTSSDTENRRLHSEDMNFVFNAEDQFAQWDPLVLQARRNRPSYTFNRVIHDVNMVCGDMAQVEPQIKVRAAVKDASVLTAEVFEGLIRDIEHASRARTTYNMAFKQAVAGGFGVWRVVPEYADDGESFDQVLRIKLVPNPLTAFWNPECQDPYRADAMWGGLAETIDPETYKVLYPGKHAQSFSMNRDSKGWVTADSIRICEYFKRVAVEKELLQLDDGRVLDADEMESTIAELAGSPAASAAPKITNRRKYKKWYVDWYKVDASNVLEGPIRYEWKKIPLIRLPGRFIAIEGKQKCQSLIRHAKDGQRAYNLHRSTMIEAVALTPRAPYMATPKMIKAYEPMWATANSLNRPYLLYDIDTDAAAAGVQGGKPSREQPPDVPEALVTLAQQDLADVQAATGYFDASLGSQVSDSDRTSGSALVARQRRGDLGSQEFLTSLSGALEVTYRCLTDMIPKTMVGPRTVRILGSDLIEKYVTVNQADSDGNIMHELAKGSYDVTCTVGPGYATSRQDTLETLLEAYGAVPQLGMLGPDILARNIDMPDAGELARRARIPLIQQGLVQPTAEEKAMMPPPPQPDPMQMMQQQLMQSKIAKGAADAQISQSKASVGDIDINRLIAEAAGKHLANIIAAQQIGMNHPELAAAQAEHAAASVARPGVPPSPGAPNSPRQ